MIRERQRREEEAFATRVNRSPGCINRGIMYKEKEVRVLLYLLCSLHGSQVCPDILRRHKGQEGLETLVGQLWELRLTPGLGNMLLLPVSAGYLCSVASEAQLGPTGTY